MTRTGRIVVITGASSGIGEASAAEFAKNGDTTVLVARRSGELDRVEKKLAGLDAQTLAIPCDISDYTQVRRMSESVLERFGRLDVLVNNAGFAVYGKVQEQTIREIESQMKTNYMGMIHCTKSFLAHLLDRGSGHIVNVASVAGSVGLPGIAPYCASKFAMLGFSEGLKHELKGTGVGITVVSPIMVRTSFFDHPSFGKLAREPRLSLSAGTVARAVLRAADSHRLEMIVPFPVRGAVWAKQTFPYLVNPLLGSSFRKKFDSST